MTSENARTLEAYERAAARYRAQVPAVPPPDIDAILVRLADRIPGGRVLELGSGPGTDARRLEDLGLSVTRTDATRAFVDLLHADGYDAAVLNAITDELGGPYDAIYAGAMLLHLPVPDLEPFLVRARAAAGVLAFSVKEGDGETWTTARLDVPRWYVYWREAPLRAALVAAGWTVEHVHGYAGRHDDWLQVLAS